MTPSTGNQIITIHVLPNILRSKYDQIMKFGQLMEYNMRNIFLQNSCRRYDREISSRPYFILKLYMGQKQVISTLFQSSTWTNRKNKQYRTLDFRFRDMLNSDFMKKRSETSFCTTFCVWCFKKNASHVIFY